MSLRFFKTTVRFIGTLLLRLIENAVILFEDPSLEEFAVAMLHYITFV